MAACHSSRFAHLLKKGLAIRQVWTKPNNCSFVVSAQAVLMTAMTDFEPLAKRLRVESGAPTSPSSSPKVPSIPDETVNQERRQNHRETTMDTQPETRADYLRGVKKKDSHQRIGPRQQQKFKGNTLEPWLLRYSKESTAEVCQTQEDVKMTDDGASQSTSAQSLDGQNVEIHSISDSDEETQPLTPPDLDEDHPVSPASKDPATSGLEKQEMEPGSVSAEGSVMHNNKKITDFFPTSSSSRLPVRRKRPEKSPEKQDSDDDTTSAEVTWMGTPINELKRTPECGGPQSPLKDVPDQHTVMIRTDRLQSGKLPVPYPEEFEDTWDGDHVRMPCSSHSLFPVDDEETGQKQNKSRWELIKETLNKELTDPYEFKNAILKYSSSNAKKRDFTSLRLYCTKFITVLYLFGLKSLLWDQIIIRHHTGSPSVLCSGAEDLAGQRGLPGRR